MLKQFCTDVNVRLFPTLSTAWLVDVTIIIIIIDIFIIITVIIKEYTYTYLLAVFSKVPCLTEIYMQ